MRTWLVEKRRKKGFSQENISEIAGVTRQMISAIENGANPSVEVAKSIAEALDFDWTEFYEEQKTG